MIVMVWIFPLVALAAAVPLGVLVVSAALGGAAQAAFGSIWETAKQVHTPAHLRARLGSFDHLGGLGLVPFGYLLGAAILATVGPAAGLIAGASILVIATLWVATDSSVRDLKAGATMTWASATDSSLRELRPKALEKADQRPQDMALVTGAIE